MDALALAASLSILLAVLAFALVFLSSGAVRAQVRSRLEVIMAGGTSVVEGSAVAPLRETRTVRGFLRLVISGAWLERMGEELRRSDSQLQPGDFIAIRVALAALSFAGSYLLIGGVLGFFAGLVAAAIGFQVPQLWINNRRAARGRKLEEQLPEALTLISNSLKSGFGLGQSLSLAADQLEHPIATELAQTIHELSVGSSAEEAFTNLGERAASDDLGLVVTAILVQRSVGGNLAEILDTVAGTMRERVRIRGEITTLTAQQQLTGVVIGLLPVAVGGMLLVISPDYMTMLFTETVGRVALGVAVLLEVVGVVIIRRILSIEV